MLSLAFIFADIPLSVSAEELYSVSIVDSGGGSLVLEDGSYGGLFEPDELISMAVTCDEGYYLKDVEILDDESEELLATALECPTYVVMSQESVSFYMTDSDVIVSPVFEKKGDEEIRQSDRIAWKDIDWTKYGNNGILDENYYNYFKSIGIDPLKDENYGTTYAKYLESQPKTLDRLNDWEVGTVHWGMCDIQASWMVGSQSYFTLGNFRDGLDGVEMLGSGWCMDHTAAEPQPGHGVVSVMCTVTSVDRANGWIYMSLYLTPYDVTQGNYNQWGLIGYQHIGANVRKRMYFGNAKIYKSAKDTYNITVNNNSYSLKNAFYGIWGNEACTAGIGFSFTTDENGEAILNGNLSEGWYYVKELIPPNGYAIDSTVYPVYISGNRTSNMYLQDVPKMVKVEVLLYKKDSITNSTTPTRDGTLENAEYTVNYYKGGASTPTRTWVFKTDSNGQVKYQDSYKVSGDELYYLPDGVTPALPLGSITIQETKAPDGYVLNDEVKTVQLSTDGSYYTTVLSNYNAPTFLERPDLIQTSINLSKVGPVNESIGGASFGLYSDQDCTKEVQKKSTDTDGKISFEELGYLKDGETKTLYLKELSVARPYIYDDTVHEIKFVRKGLKVSIFYDNVDYTDKGDVNISIKTENYASTASVKIHNRSYFEEISMKISKKAKGTDTPIEGAVFKHTFTDSEGAEVTKTYTTNKNGVYNIPKGDLTVGIHTLKEVSCPPNFKVNPGVLTFEVTKEAYIVEVSNTSKEETGAISLSVIKDGYEATVDMKDEYALFDLNIIKKNDQNKILSGAEFTLYSNEDCTKELGKKVSGEDGTVMFNDLILTETYYLKETKAPQGYAENDKVYTISATCEGTFKLFVDGNVYQTKEITADKMIGDFTVINRVGQKLPKTGTRTLFVMSVLGLSLMFVIFVRRKGEVQQF